MLQRTEQDIFWEGEFGNEYIKRVPLSKENIAKYTVLYSKVSQQFALPPQSFLEFGANVGFHLCAINKVFPNAKLGAVEINVNALNILRSLECEIEIFDTSILDFEPIGKNWDVVSTGSLLSCLHPSVLAIAYARIYNSSSKYIFVYEPYSPVPVPIPDYRGHKNKLFKRDFAGELMDSYPDLTLKDYGFLYHRDIFAYNDLSWFLLEKK